MGDQRTQVHARAREHLDAMREGLDEILKGEHPADVDEPLEVTAQRTLTFMRDIERVADGGAQEALTRLLSVFGFPTFVLEVDETTAVYIHAEDGYWEASASQVDAADAATVVSVLARHAIKRALPVLLWPGARTLEGSLLTAAGEKVEEARRMVERGGQCNDAGCERFGYLGQSSLCERCRSRTTCSDGVTDFGAAAKALEFES